MTISPQDFHDAWNRLIGPNGYAMEGLRKTGVPGMAIAVVYQGQPYYACVGTRDLALGDQAPVDVNTVFPLASLSKPITSTILAYEVTRWLAGGWNTPVGTLDPSYKVDDRVSIASLLAHRSGLIDHAGDLLEDLGFTRERILQLITTLPTWPHLSIAPYACDFAYTNFGFSEAAFAVARLLKQQWEDVGHAFFQTHGMSSTSYRYADFLERGNAVKSYQRTPVPRADHEPLPPNPKWFAPAQRRNPDAQSPAGGVTSSVSDLIPWMMLNLRAQPVPPGLNDNLRYAHSPYPGPDKMNYGMGWKIGKEDAALGVTLGHSGAFLLGAATCVSLLPEHDLGIVALTNGQPIGLPEAICHQFAYDVTNHPGRTSFEETLDYAAKLIQGELYPVPDPDYSRPPTAPKSPIAHPSEYTGTYFNDYYQGVTISGSNTVHDPFVMQAGPEGERFVLTPYEGLTFTFPTTGENANGLSAVTFRVDPPGHVQAIVVHHFTMPDANDGLTLKPGLFKKRPG